MTAQLIKAAVTAEAWKKGLLLYKLDANQRGMYFAYRETTYPKFVFDVARRVGKSTVMMLIGIEDCLRRPNSMVKYGAATQEMVKEIILPIKDWICEDAPKELRPHYKPTEYALVFHNGSRMKLVGLDTHSDRLRGTALDTALIDEAGFVAELEYVVQSILVPQMQGRPHARILLGSTPPRSPSHKWSTRYVPEAKTFGAYIHRTIEHNPRLSPTEREFFIAEAGGADAVENRRENYAEHVVDEDISIIPEFYKREKDIVVELERPKYFDAYVSLDPGFTDLSVALFAYYDFEHDKLVIEDEICMAKTNTQLLANTILRKEHDLWHGVTRKDGKKQPYMRVSDTNPRLISDMQIEHQLEFVPTAKDNKSAAIQAVRVGVIRKYIQVNPRCTTLIAHMKHGVWNQSRTDFDRSGDYGHFDAIDALIYLVRNVHKASNPFPSNMKGESSATHHFSSKKQLSSAGQQLKKIFSPRWR